MNVDRFKQYFFQFAFAQRKTRRNSDVFVSETERKKQIYTFAQTLHLPTWVFFRGMMKVCEEVARPTYTYHDL